ncbi:hypothetical protein EDD22DRAFT_854051 [Suillus occidentalis]|nr:hypothetical protein EDD22DRAFT_854051 [Suillus occidentalis]
MSTTPSLPHFDLATFQHDLNISLAGEDKCPLKIEAAGHNRQLQADVMSLDEVDMDPEHNKQFLIYTINVVYASYAAAQHRVRQYSQLLTILKREEDEWAGKVEQTSDMMPEYKPTWLLQAL